MLPTATIAHILEGRLRVKIPERRGDTGFFRNVIDTLSSHPAVTRLEANPATGSVLIQHRTDPGTLGAFAADAGLFLLQEEVPKAARNVALAERAAADIGLPVPQTARAAGLGLLGLSAYAAARGNVVGPASENFWHAFGAWRLFNNPGLTAALIALGLVQIARGQVAGSAVSLALYALVTLEVAGLDPLSRVASNRPDGRAEAARQTRSRAAASLA